MAEHVDLGRAVERAMRAPSVHNTQPWLWRLRPGAVELFADWTRHLYVTDPDRRDLLMSCGAALHHLVVALAAEGAATEVERMPDPEDSGHVATVTLRDGPPDPVDVALAEHIEARRTDRRPLSKRPVPVDMVWTLVQRAAAEEALLLPVRDPGQRERLARAMDDAAAVQRREPGYAAELQRWTHRYAGSRDGVTAAAHVVLAGPAPPPLRAVGRPRTGPRVPGAELLVLVTGTDDPVAQLRAGEATSAVLLAATGLGLATTPMSQSLEVPDVRAHLQRDVLRVPELPQLVVRAGWPEPDAPPVPPTPRRPLHCVLLP